MNDYRGNTQGFDLTNMGGGRNKKRVPVLRPSLIASFVS